MTSQIHSPLTHSTPPTPPSTPPSPPAAVATNSGVTSSSASSRLESSNSSRSATTRKLTAPPQDNAGGLHDPPLPLRVVCPPTFPLRRCCARARRVRDHRCLPAPTHRCPAELALGPPLPPRRSPRDSRRRPHAPRHRP